ncbi:MAG: alanine--tRNA ligase [Dehalococcoidia bacterium]|nr:alanine--tRNA ligase [Dehalococcoidia bacterium]MSQ34636.1 alanine--tRNA ligase [Dehalococcoidia bacterium]
MPQHQPNSTGQPKTADQLREAFLSFFEARGHLRMQAASLIPANDPTLLLTNSGMAQFKQYFSGELEPPQPRITTSQKSFRTTDIESVGDATHLTLFEMLGNFSFGDYFKKEACAWALEFMTHTLKLDPERLYMTVFQDDDEAVAIWRNLGVPAERIYRFGARDNFWGPAGDEGPCGPCSELHYYNGDLNKVPSMDDPIRKKDWGPNLHKDFVELYNLVFTQLYHHADGRRTELPKMNIDTGMGLERVLVVLQGTKNIYETDLFTPLIKKAMQLSGREWGTDHDTNRALSVVAEHGRSASFLIGDGVIPGNTGRGYVLRRLIRRGMLFGRQLGLKETFLPELSTVASEVMGGAYPELVKNGPFIKRVLELEEERFSRTLEFGSTVLDGMIEYRRRYAASMHGLVSDMRAATAAALSDPVSIIGKRNIEQPTGDDARAVGRRAAAEALSGHAAGFARALSMGGGVGSPTTSHEVQAAEQSLVQWASSISGREAFLLYDTYGFPIEVTREFLQDHQFTVDGKGFESEMQAQRERGRAAGQKFGGDMSTRHIYEELGVDETPFLGYHATSAASVIIGIVRDGEAVQSALPGEKVEVVLRETPFYAEKGGQVGDTGIISGEGLLLEVTDTLNPYGHVNVHHCVVKQGVVKPGLAVRADVDTARRDRIRRNHTATHLLHAALREVVGQHVRQAGSLVAPDRLRFDFTHMAPLTQAELKAVQDRVNEQIRANTDVSVEHTTYSAAVKKGALAFFGDKYENDVRTICITGVYEHSHDGHTHTPAGSKPTRNECWSYELCGGTHMDRTGGIGSCIIISETGIGAGMRRLEALTGAGADEAIWDRFSALNRLSACLHAPVNELESRAEMLQRDLDAARKKIAGLEDLALRASLEGGPSHQSQMLRVEMDGASAQVQVSRIEAANADTLRRAGDHMRDRLGSGVLVLGAVIDGQPAVVVMVTKDLNEKGFHAGNIARGLANILGGGGGGRPDLAQAGGKDPARLDEALSAIERIIIESASAKPGGRK